MSQWPSTKSRIVLKALIKIGWSIKREKSGSHKTLSREGWEEVGKITYLRFMMEQRLGQKCCQE